MIEVEIRAKVDDLESVKNKLNEVGAKFINTKKQVDRVFGHPNSLDEENKVIEGHFSARIRQVDDNIKVDFKEILREKGRIEISSRLGSIDSGLKFLYKIGYKEAFTISKTRDTFEHNSFTICLDNVDKLGCFIEIEKIINTEEEQDKVRDECTELLKQIYPNSKIETRKYGDLMQELVNKEEY